jgi:hypothetical protein
MRSPLTRAILDRPKQTIHACEQIHENAWSIAQACSEVNADQVVVAFVDHEDMIYGGLAVVPRSDLRERLGAMDPADWQFVFRPGTTVDQVRDRALEVARLAFRRWETLLRWSARHT